MVFQASKPMPTTSNVIVDNVEYLAFDEDWYLEKYKDVEAAISRNAGFSALEHYVKHGRSEGRLPTRPREQLSQADIDFKNLVASHNGVNFLTPRDLSVSEVPVRRVALIGSCFIESWNFHWKNPSGCPADLFILNNAAVLPDKPPTVSSINDYDFQIIQLPLRSAWPDATFWKLNHTDIESHENAFDFACKKIEFLLQNAMKWNINSGLLTFVSNFYLPQKNPMGSLFSRYDIRNPAFFIDKLNQHLECIVRRHKNAYLLDVDGISASVGRRYIQDDFKHIFAHNSVMGLDGQNNLRIEPLQAISEYYEIKWPGLFGEAVWNEATLMFRTICQADQIKLVVVDLDDTLWSGISGDVVDPAELITDTWEIGIIEALLYLKRRGIALAIISKNEESRIREIWDKVFHGRLKFDDFASVKINWAPKTQNMHEILSVLNLLAKNVLFIDDNPAERAAMARAYSEMRIIGNHPYLHKRILLWSSETQTVTLTEEASRRTEMLRAQVKREDEKKELSREQFLANAAPKVRIFMVDGPMHPKFNRVLELINRTNQYNTTGKRWRTEELKNFFKSQAKIYSFETVDSYTDYGLVGVVLVEDANIIQCVMSCRVLGYEIEQAVMAKIVSDLEAEGYQEISGLLVETTVNFPCRTLFSSCGFHDTGEKWILPVGKVVPFPSHIHLL